MRLAKSCITFFTILLVLCNIDCYAQNKCGGINLSLWKGISTQPCDTFQTTYFNLGILSSINQLKGVSLNVFNCITANNAYGIQVSGLSNIVNGSMNGLQLSGLTNIARNSASGVTASGIANITGNSLNGIGISGLINIIGDDSRALLLAGFMNITGSNSSGVNIAGVLNLEGGSTGKGIKVAGLANVIGANQSGIALGGLMNITGNNVNGMQMASLINIAGGQTNGLQLSGLGNIGVHVRGMQIAGLSNIAKSLHGGQVGLLNIAEYATEGVQVGLVNYSKSSTKAKFGLVNVNPDTRYQLMVFGGNTSKGNVAMRFKNKLFYTILGMGDHYLGLSKKISASVFYRTGLGFEVCKNLFLSGDIGYQHIENFQNKNADGIPARMYALQSRANVEYHFTNKFGIFTSGGYSVNKYYNKGGNFSKKPILEFGIILF
jgi:hypothetical protein